MVNEQKIDTELVCQLFEDSEFGVVTAVGNVGRGSTDELKGILGAQTTLA